ncbi:MAG: PspC domain-containing protein [Candidatus Taylorbacteria bacterium]|nr:PspC domain-containing protein [Candidatus Taylorbacteria bacterium]
MNKRLYRSKTNRMISGICGGVGEYLDMDPTVLRVVWVAVVIVTGLLPGALIYLIATFVIPEEK